MRRSILPRRQLFGLEFLDLESVAEVASELVGFAPDTSHDETLPVVVTPNVDQLVKLDRRVDPVASRIVSGARYVLPDGQPIVWASRLLGTPLRGRLAGSSLVPEMWAGLLEEGRTVLVVASSEEIARRVEADGPGTHAAVAPHLSLADRASLETFVEQCTTTVRELRPSHVFVTLGFPKQCNVIDGVLSRLQGAREPLPLFLAVGASFEMHYGLVRRAPAWMQRWGLEWFFRFLQEPRRLFRRYFIDDPAFAALVWREWRARHRAGSRPS